MSEFTPIALLGSILGEWKDIEFVRPVFSPDEVDLSCLEPAVMQCLATDRQREVVRLRYFTGLSLAEVGRRTKLTAGRVFQICAKAERSLRAPYNRRVIKSACPGWWNHLRAFASSAPLR